MGLGPDPCARKRIDPYLQNLRVATEQCVREEEKQASAEKRRRKCCVVAVEFGSVQCKRVPFHLKFQYAVLLIQLVPLINFISVFPFASTLCFLHISTQFSIFYFLNCIGRRSTKETEPKMKMVNSFNLKVTLILKLPCYLELVYSNMHAKCL